MNEDACSHYKNHQRFPVPRSVILREREAAFPAYDSGAKHSLSLESAKSESLQRLFANIRGQISGMATVMSGPGEGKIHAILLTPVDERIGESVADVARTRP